MAPPVSARNDSVAYPRHCDADDVVLLAFDRHTVAKERVAAADATND
jgi:hypothetical protein